MVLVESLSNAIFAFLIGEIMKTSLFKFLLSAIVLSFAINIGLAQQAKPDDKKPLRNDDVKPAPPRLNRPMMKYNNLDEAEKKKGKYLKIVKLDTLVRAYGPLVETQMTMTFRNDLKRIAVGELLFPLPDGVTISGYALDINGKLRDAVAVTKKKARVTFEQESRKRVDPGLVEWTMGNVFRTKVYPINPGSTRTIRVSYIQKLNSTTHKMPVDFKEPIKKVSLRAEIISPVGKAKISGAGIKDLEFKQENSKYVAEYKGENISLTGNISIELPTAQLHQNIYQIASDGKVYGIFGVRLKKIANKHIKKRRPKAKFIRVIYDMSRSRAEADHAKDLETLKRYNFKYNYHSGDAAKYELYFLRDKLTKVRLAENADCNDVITSIKREITRTKSTNKTKESQAIPAGFDGGTDYSDIQFTEPYENRDKRKLRLTLVFTDGMHTIPPTRDAFRVKDSILEIFSSSLKRNKIYIDNTLERNRSYPNCQAISTYNKKPIVHVSTMIPVACPYKQNFAYKQYLQIPYSIWDRKGDSNVKFYIGYGKFNLKRTVKVPADAPKGEMLKKYYGQQTLQELMKAPEANKKYIERVGKRFNLVTPETSLIVLETLSQYLKHKICPPKSCKKLYQEYQRAMDRIHERKVNSTKAKLEMVKSLWLGRIKWWNRVQTKVAIPGKECIDLDKSIEENSGDESIKDREDADNEEKVRSLEDSVPSAANKNSRRSRPKGMKKSKAKLKKPTWYRRPSNPNKIKIKRWVPDQPYITELNKVLSSQNFSTSLSVLDALYNKYLEIAYDYSASPGFFFDCAAWFRIQAEIQTKIDAPKLQAYSKACWDKIATRILSNIAETGLADARLLRMLSYQLLDWKNYDLAIRMLRKVTYLRSEEPQSFRDLALALEAKAISVSKKNPYKKAAYLKEAISLFWYTARHKFEAQEGRFRGTEILCLEEMNNCIAKLNRLDINKKEKSIKNMNIPKWAIKLLDLDLRITLSWDADMTDIDLHVIDPYNETAYYSNRFSKQGGLVSRDFTQGYGPEQFVLRRAQKGNYTIKVKYYSSSQASIAGPVTVRAEVITNYGRPNEKRKTISMRMNKVTGIIEIGQIELIGKPFIYTGK